MNPPSTAEATLNGAVTTAGEEEEDEDEADRQTADELLLNKSEFLLNELTGGDSAQSPFTNADLMAIMMFTMRNPAAASAADQISLNGVSSSLATTALPTVFTPLYNEAEQYRRRRRHHNHTNSQANRRNRSSSSTAKKCARARRRKSAQQAANGAGKVRRTKVPPAGEEANEQTDKNQEEPVKADNGDSAPIERTESAAQTDVVRKPKVRKRKRVLNLTTTNDVINATNQTAIKTNDAPEGTLFKISFILF